MNETMRIGELVAITSPYNKHRFTHPYLSRDAYAHVTSSNVCVEAVVINNMRTI
jgi:hypothetical protein